MLSAVHASASKHFLNSTSLSRAARLLRSSKSHGHVLNVAPNARCLSTDSTDSRPDVSQAENVGPSSEPSPSPAIQGVKGLMRKLKETMLDDVSHSRPGDSHFKKLAVRSQRKRRNSLKKYERPNVQVHSFNSNDNVLPVREGKKKKKKKKKRLEKDLMTLAELVDEISDENHSGLKPESWKNDWGKDELAPMTPTHECRPPHFPQRLPAYVRRIEGLIEPSTKDVLEELEPPTGKVPIATLAHGLDRVLFNPGVHWVQDPRSRVYNFSPFIQHVPDIKDFAFERLTPFVKSSRDTVMRDLAAAKGKRFAGSTSSLSGLLSHIYFLISQDHKVDTRSLAMPFSSLPANFTPGQRMPAAVVFNHKNGIYMIDSDSTDNDDSQWNILMWMGTMLENFFTLPKDKFKKLLRSLSNAKSIEDKPAEAYRYSQSKIFVMRSQLDSHDPRLPGTGVFDIKTRAALPLRMDNLNFKENSGYLIKALHGPLESFDREYYDLIRSAFLKYSFQARIGNMDGIFIAYHNTARIFGFQYVPLEEMDERLFGAKDRGWRVFNKCVGLLEVVAEEIVNCFPGKSVTCLAETLEGSGVMRIWVQPVEDELEAEEIPEVSSNLQRPIVQLDVTVDNFLDDVHVGGKVTISSVESAWTLHWSISRSSLSGRAIRKNLEAAKGRKYRPNLYPTGVDSDNLEEFLKNLGFGEVNCPPNKTRFVSADFHIEALREVARAGQLETERLEKEERQKEKQIWQQTTFDDDSYHDAFETFVVPENIEEVETDLSLKSTSYDSSGSVSGSVPSHSELELSETSPTSLTVEKGQGTTDNSSDDLQEASSQTREKTASGPSATADNGVDHSTTTASQEGRLDADSSSALTHR